MRVERERLREALRHPKAALGALLALARGRLCVWKLRLRGVDVEVGRNFRCYGPFVVGGRGRLRIGNDVVVHRNLRHVFIGGGDGWQVRIGDRVWLNGTSISCRDRVEIGDRALVGRVDIVDHEFHDPRDPERRRRIRTAPVVVGEDAWIGNDSLILKGVRIGRRTVVGARTVVRRSLPDDVVAIGNPAQVVKELRFEDG